MYFFLWIQIDNIFKFDNSGANKNPPLMTKLVCNAKLGLPMTCHILPYHKLAAQKITELTLLLLFLQSSSTSSTCPVISLTQTFADYLSFIIGVLCAPTLNFCWGLGEFFSYRGGLSSTLTKLLNLNSICYISHFFSNLAIPLTLNRS